MKYFKSLFKSKCLPSKVQDHIYKIRNLDRNEYLQRLNEILIRHFMINNPDKVIKANFHRDDIDDTFEEEIELEFYPDPRNDDPLHWDNTTEKQIITDFSVFNSLVSSQLSYHYQPDPDIYLQIDIRLKDALQIKKKTFTLTYPRLIQCGATLCKKEDEQNTCPMCYNGRLHFHENTFICKHCNGSGRKNSNCPQCNDEKLIRTKHTVRISFDDKFQANMVYNYNNLGNYDIINRRYGGLKVKTKIVNDESAGVQFIVKQEDGSVETKENVSFSKLALGGNLKVQHARGEGEIFIHECTQPGDYKVIDGLGIPMYLDRDEDEMVYGSLIVYFNCHTPKVKDQVVLNLFQELAKHDDYNEINKLNHA